MLLEDLNSRYDRYMHKNYLTARDMYRERMGKPPSWRNRYHGLISKQFCTTQTSLSTAAQATRIAYDKMLHGGNRQKFCDDEINCARCGVVDDLRHILVECLEPQLVELRAEALQACNDHANAQEDTYIGNLLLHVTDMAIHHPTSQFIWQGTWSTEMVNEIQVRHGNQLSNKSQEQLRRVNKALMYVLKELGAASRRLVTAARFLRQQIPAVGRRHSELRNVRLVIGGGRQRARRRNYRQSVNRSIRDIQNEVHSFRGRTRQSSYRQTLLDSWVTRRVTHPVGIQTRDLVRGSLIA
jgi:hypothetical protein